MQRYVVKRLLWGIPTILGALTFIFLLLRVAPGDVAMMIMGEEQIAANPEAVARLREELGLNVPLYQQYFAFLGNLLHGNLGISQSHKADTNAK